MRRPWKYMLVVQGCYTLIINGERIPGDRRSLRFLARNFSKEAFHGADYCPKHAKPFRDSPARVER
jgi:hypothetical protein